MRNVGLWLALIAAATQVGGIESSRFAPGNTTESAVRENPTVVWGVVETDGCPRELPANRVCSPRPVPGCTVVVVVGDPLGGAGFLSGGTAGGLSTTLKTTTDERGMYSVELPLVSGREQLSITTRKNGYRTTQVDTSVSRNETLELGFDLLPSRPLPVGFGSGISQAGAPGIMTYSSHDRLLTIRIPQSQTVSIEVFLINGKKEQRLSTNRFFPAGAYTFSLDGSRFGSGMAVITVRGQGFSETRRIPVSGG